MISQRLIGIRGTTGLVALIASLALAGCGSDAEAPLAPPAPAAPKATLTAPTWWDFGTVCAGGTAQRTYSFDVTADSDNEGDATGTIKMAPSSHSRFTIVSGGGPYTLAPGEKKTFQVRLQPDQAGRFYEGTVQIADGVTMSVEGFGGATPYYQIEPTALNGGAISSNNRAWMSTNGVSISYGSGVTWSSPGWLTCATSAWVFNGNSLTESKKEFEIDVPNGMTSVAIQVRGQADSDCTQLLIEIDGKEHKYENLSSCATREWRFPITPGKHVFGIGTDQQGALCYADLAVTKVRFEFSGRCLTDAEWNF